MTPNCPERPASNVAPQSLMLMNSQFVVQYAEHFARRVHFRAELPISAAADAWTLAVFHSRVARGGFVEEDGEIWSADGLLLAHSRQLALVA